METKMKDRKILVRAKMTKKIKTLYDKSLKV